MIRDFEEVLQTDRCMLLECAFFVDGHQTEQRW